MQNLKGSFACVKEKNLHTHKVCPQVKKNCANAFAEEIYGKSLYYEFISLESISNLSYQLPKE